MCKRLFFVLAASALLLLQFGDCMSAMQLDQESMQCCRSMPCTPAHHSSGCCKDMASVQTPNMLPAEHVLLHGPTVASVEYPLNLEIAPSIPAPFVAVNAPQQHSPPDLYTLNVSLLI
jgi:hypothetical protein